MNSIKNLLKASPIAMVVVGLVVAGAASAALVTYLSNDVTTTTSIIESPIKMGVNEGSDAVNEGNHWNAKSSTENDSLTMPCYAIDGTKKGTCYGGDTFVYTTVSENQSSGNIDGYAVTVVEGGTDVNLTGQEFKMMKAEFKVEGYPIEFDITDDTYVVCKDGTLKQLQNEGWTWNAPKLVTTICYTLIADSGVCADANRDVTEITMAGETTDWVISRFTLADAIIGAAEDYTVKGNVADDLAEYAAGQYGISDCPCTWNGGFREVIQ